MRTLHDGIIHDRSIHDVRRFFPRFLIDVTTCYDVRIRMRHNNDLFIVPVTGCAGVPVTKTIRRGKVGARHFDA